MARGQAVGAKPAQSAWVCNRLKWTLRRIQTQWDRSDLLSAWFIFGRILCKRFHPPVMLYFIQLS